MKITFLKLLCISIGMIDSALMAMGYDEKQEEVNYRLIEEAQFYADRRAHRKMIFNLEIPAEVLAFTSPDVQKKGLEHNKQFINKKDK